MTRNEQYHRFSKLDYAANFLRQATDKPIRKWMLKDALKRQQTIYLWKIREDNR
ncbi:MAG: hypothetical protein ABF691_13020 [Lentilactobacillus hilgardii]